jgi:hypothetical protein
VKYFIAHVLAYSLQYDGQEPLTYVLAVTTNKPTPEQIIEWMNMIALDYVASEYYAPDEMDWERIGDVWILKTDNEHIDELHISEVDKELLSNGKPISALLGVTPLVRRAHGNRND